MAPGRLSSLRHRLFSQKMSGRRALARRQECPPPTPHRCGTRNITQKRPELTKQKQPFLTYYSAHQAEVPKVGFFSGTFSSGLRTHPERTEGKTASASPFARLAAFDGHHGPARRKSILARCFPIATTLGGKRFPYAPCPTPCRFLACETINKK